MGGRRFGRSELAFGVASTTALPPPTCTARREAGQRRLRLLFCCEAGQLLAVVLLRGLCQADCLPAVFACSSLVLRALFACSPFAMPCPLSSTFLPRSVLLCPPPCQFHVRQDRRSSCTDCPVGSCNTGLQWRPVRRFTFDCFFFFLQSPLILGHGLV